MQIQERGGMLVPVSDALLARVTLAGDQKAFAMLIQRHYIAMFNFIYRFLSDGNSNENGDYQRACDILHETCLRIYHALNDAIKDTSFKLWFLRTAYCCCVDELRRQSGETCCLSQVYGVHGMDEETLSMYGISGNVAGQLPLSVDILARPDIEHVLQQAIALLPPKLRAAIILRSILFLNCEEIGQVLAMPASAAQTCCERAKMLIRHYVRERRELTTISVEKM